MRIALHFPEDDPLHPGAIAAYKLGRIQEGVHNVNIATGERIPLEDLIARMMRDAQEEFPSAQVVVERLVEDPSVWLCDQCNFRGTEEEAKKHAADLARLGPKLAKDYVPGEREPGGEMEPAEFQWDEHVVHPAAHVDETGNVVGMEGKWIAVDEFDPSVDSIPGTGATEAVEVNVQQAADGGGNV